jgi:hypothetical protein
MCPGIAGCLLLGENVILNIFHIRSERVKPPECMKLKFKRVKLTVHNPYMIIQNAGDLKSSCRFKGYKKRLSVRIPLEAWMCISILFCDCFVRLRNAPSPSAKEGVAP